MILDKNCNYSLMAMTDEQMLKLSKIIQEDYNFLCYVRLGTLINEDDRWYVRTDMDFDISKPYKFLSKIL